MNYLPSIEQSKKKNRFVGPSSGIIYDNKSFLKHCHYEEGQPEESHIKHRKVNESVNFAEKKLRKMNRKYQSTNRPCIIRKEYLLEKKNQLDSLQTVQTLISDSHSIHNAVNCEEEDEFVFPDIEVRVIEGIDKVSDVENKILKINLGFYFNNFFRKSLKGKKTPQFIQVVEKEIKNMMSKLSSGNSDQSIDKSNFPEELFLINSVQAFSHKINRLQMKNNQNFIDVLVKYHCIPSKEYRQSCLRDIILILSQEASKKFKLLPKQEFIILSEKGQEIKDILQIPFSTKILHLSYKDGYQFKFGHYVSIFNNFGVSERKSNFILGLKKSFRGDIAKGMFREVEDYEKKIENSNRISKVQTRRAEIMITMHRNSQNQTEMANSRKSNSLIDRQLALEEKSRQMKMKLSLLASRRRKSLTSSPTTGSKVSKISAEFLTLQNLEKETKKRKNTEKSSFFQDREDESPCFISLQTLQANHPIFKNKSKAEIEKIFIALSIFPHKKYSLTEDEFTKVINVANCEGDPEPIIKFVNKYLCFDELGELDRQGLAYSLELILKEGPHREVLEELLWSWLQKNKLVSRDVVQQSSLESSFGKNKLFYRFIISLILNYKHISAIDMAYEILI